MDCLLSQMPISLGVGFFWKDSPLCLSKLKTDIMMRVIIFVPLLFTFISCSSQVNNDISQGTIPVDEVEVPIQIDSAEVEIVFCLDATGSMGGLISTAKEKIWSIVTEVVDDTIPTRIKLGIVFYRDKTDNFVTKVIPLTGDLDYVYNQLLNIQAQGGGDTPESLNQGLYEAVIKNDWSTNDNVYKTIFVIGDCPPHMDYKNEVQYTESCKMARKKGIIINSIKLGPECEDATTHFKNMASCAGGAYLHLSQNAKDQIITTPYDNKINELSKSIDDSKIYYGTKQEKRAANKKKEMEMSFYTKASSTANNARVNYKLKHASKKDWMGNKELLEDYENGSVNLDSIQVSVLPKIYRSMTTEEVKQDLSVKSKKRKKLIDDLLKWNKERAKFINNEKKNSEGEESFSTQIGEVMKSQKKK
ncbi:MAG: Mg-chelatase subunit ChlD [Saprospiraceae bacterium]|jgi:Mg-chelatase subunit ChlD